MTATASSSSLFSNFKNRLSKAFTGRAGHDQYHPMGTHDVDQKTPILQELDTELIKKDIDLRAAKNVVGRNRGASNARSAFAAGAASRAKKLFRRSGTGSFGAIGRTDAATSKAIADREKEIVDLRSLNPNINKATGENQPMTLTAGPIIKLW